MFPLSIVGSIGLPDSHGSDAIEVARELEQKLALAPWRAERQDNRLHFEGGVYSESTPGWRILLSPVGICRIEVLSAPELVLAYKANTGEMSLLAAGLAVGLGLVTEAALHMPIVALIVAVCVWAGVALSVYAYEGRRLRAFLRSLLAGS
ncbi:MAG TPA: hypothetical protein VFG89_06260 [Coriobacteriia bacterium]|nr:hypothetical protein [Coriobacteriia bacterium]